MNRLCLVYPNVTFPASTWNSFYAAIPNKTNHTREITIVHLIIEYSYENLDSTRIQNLFATNNWNVTRGIIGGR